MKFTPWVLSRLLYNASWGISQLTWDLPPHTCSFRKNATVSSSADTFWCRSLSLTSISNASASGSVPLYRSKRFLAISIDTNELNGAHGYLILPKFIVKLKIARTAPHSMKDLWLQGIWCVHAQLRGSHLFWQLMNEWNDIICDFQHYCQNIEGPSSARWLPNPVADQECWVNVVTSVFAGSPRIASNDLSLSPAYLKQLVPESHSPHFITSLRPEYCHSNLDICSSCSYFKMFNNLIRDFVWLVAMSTVANFQWL